LKEIFHKKILEQEWTTDVTSDELNAWFETRMEHYPHFGRDMELLLMYTKIAHSRRVYGKSEEEIRTITICDVNEGQELFLSNKKKQKNKTTSVSLQAMYV